MESLEDRHSGIQSGIFGGYRTTHKPISPLKKAKRMRSRQGRVNSSAKKNLRSKEAKAWKDKMFGGLNDGAAGESANHSLNDASSEEIKIQDTAEFQGEDSQMEEIELGNQVSRLDRERLVQKHYQEESPKLRDGVVTKAVIVEPQEVEIIRLN